MVDMYAAANPASINPRRLGGRKRIITRMYAPSLSPAPGSSTSATSAVKIHGHGRSA